MGAARKGFSIIEVLMAVVIASIAGMALMESAAQGRRAYDAAIHHRDTAETASLAALSSHAMGGVGQSDAITLISARYTIDNPRIVEKLRKHYYILHTERTYGWNESNETNATLKAVATISENAIEETKIDTDGVITTLYGLSGEGW